MNNDNISDFLLTSTILNSFACLCVVATEGRIFPRYKSNERFAVSGLVKKKISQVFEKKKRRLSRKWKTRNFFFSSLSKLIVE